MRYFSMFSGIGGFELGIQQILPNAECVGFSEVDKWAVSIYQRNFKGHKNYGDATKIIPKELPDFDILVGGVPCQSWSIAGKRQGFNCKNGSLWDVCFDLLKEKQPKMFIFENVKGILSHDKGISFIKICEKLCEAGYVIDFDLLNSKNHGVAQNRERVFIIGKRIDILNTCQVF